MNKFLFIFFLFIVLGGKAVTHASEFDKHVQWLKKHELPSDHPAKPLLDYLSKTQKITKSLKVLERNGFKSIRPSNIYNPVVLRHPKVPGWIFKTFIDDSFGVVSSEFEAKHWFCRIKGAQVIREYLKKHNLSSSFTVPKKWVYRLPKSKKGWGYILVVEDMNLIPHKKNLACWQNISKETLDILYLIIHDLRLWDLHSGNLSFTKKGQLAFIDTKHWGEFIAHNGNEAFFYDRVAASLSAPNLEYWYGLWGIGL